MLSVYGSDGCILVLAGISLHIVFAAIILQPIKYHYKRNSDIVEKVELQCEQNLLRHSVSNLQIDDAIQNSDNNKKPTWLMKSFQWLRKTFDLDLLRDKIYINIMVGMSITIFVEINFVMLMPFVLSDMNYTIVEVASLMSILAIVDILFRFISPFVGDYFKLGPRIMFLISLAILTVTRVGNFFFLESFIKFNVDFEFRYFFSDNVCEHIQRCLYIVNCLWNCQRNSYGLYTCCGSWSCADSSFSVGNWNSNDN